MSYLYIKSLHVIFMVCWFAGIFYLVRLLIYYKEAEKQDENTRLILQNQYTIMTKRLLYYITWPACLLTFLFGFSLIYINPILLNNNWLISKLFFVFLLLLYTFSCQILFNQMKKGKINYTESFLRLWNEVATVLLFIIVFLAILKNSVSILFLSSLIISVVLVLFGLIKLYKIYNLKNQSK